MDCMLGCCADARYTNGAVDMQIWELGVADMRNVTSFTYCMCQGSHCYPTEPNVMFLMPSYTDAKV